jgi:hypothetical protein
MPTSGYKIHRSIGRPISFRGIKGHYILLAAADILLTFLFLILFYCLGIPPWLDMILTIGPGVSVLFIISRLSRKYGPQGLMKFFAARRLPAHLRYPTRNIFLNLKTKKNGTPVK